MTVINTNTAAIKAQYNLNKVQSQMDNAMERLSSGKRINTASDDAAGIAISTRMQSEINGIQQAIRNASDGQALIDTAEGAHDEVSNMLQRMRELAVQSANDTNSDNDRAALQLEIDALLTEIDRVSESTSWAGKTLMGGAEGGESTFSFQVGSTSAAQDQIAITIGDTSADAIGIGNSGVASGGRVTGPAGIIVDGGKISIEGQPEQGDIFSFTMNGKTVSATFSVSDEYEDTAAGAAAQLRDAIDAIVIANPDDFPGYEIKDLGDGTLEVSQGSSVNINNVSGLTGTAPAIDVVNGTMSFTYTAVTDAFAFDVNGITVTMAARASTDNYSADAAGTAAKVTALIGLTEGLENVTVVDHGDGSISLSQSTVPAIEGARVNLTTEPTITAAYTTGTAATPGTITISGAFVADQTMSFELFGEEISFTTSTSDGFEDNLAGVTRQMVAAINDAGLMGVSASKGTGNTVTLVADVLVENATVDSGAEFIVTTIGEATTASVALTNAATDPVTTSTAMGTTAGDAYTFEVLGREVKLVVGSGGYANSVSGIAQQMKDLVDGLGIAGLNVAIDAAASGAKIDISRDLNGEAGVTRSATNQVAAIDRSTVFTNFSSLSADQIGDPTFTGSISVASAESSANAIERIDAALTLINEQRAELGAVSNRLDHTITNLSNVNTNIQSSQSRIQDADFATETSAMTKAQILSQAATAMLAQANASKQSVLSLLQG